jgi:hypothetical protein
MTNWTGLAEPLYTLLDHDWRCIRSRDWCQRDFGGRGLCVVPKTPHLLVNHFDLSFASRVNDSIQRSRARVAPKASGSGRSVVDTTGWKRFGRRTDI